MKKILLNLALLASMSLVLNSCLGLGEEDEDDNTDPSSFSTGTMTATVDGSAWESKPVSAGGQTIAYSYAAVSNEVLTILGTAVSGVSSSNINITVSGYTGPGTYTFGVDASSNFAGGQYITVNTSTFKSTVHMAGVYSSGIENSGSGEIIVTSEEEVDGKKVVTGTFKFTTGLSLEDNVEIENASIEVTNGAFKLTSAI